MSTKLFSYNRFSKSGKALADGMGIKRIKHTGSRWKPCVYDTVINWGSSVLPDNLQGVIILNSPDKVVTATDKIAAFDALTVNEVPCPVYTTVHETALEWAEQGTVICRTLTRANSGRGIVVAYTPDQMVNAPLYTKYFKRADEYRVHVVRGEIIDVQRKMRKNDVPDEEINWCVRNHSNGFIFGRGGVVAPDVVLDASVKAVHALGLDFGAVDIGYNKHHNTAAVFEVNTAPGLEGSTLEKYIQSLTSLCNPVF